MAKHRTTAPGEPRLTERPKPVGLRRPGWATALGLAVAVTVVGTVAVMPSAATVTADPAEYLATCRTDADGRCTVRHSLDIIPTTLETRPRIPKGRPPFTVAAVPGSQTTERFEVEALRPDGRVKANSLIQFHYRPIGQVSATSTTLAPTSPPTTTTIAATTTTTVPVTTTTSTTARTSTPGGGVGKVCGTSALDGPATPPEGAVVVPAGDNSGVDFRRTNTTYWFEPGVHTLGSDEFAQIIPGDNSTFVGAPGAVIDGARVNKYAFTGQARNVIVRYLEITRFEPPIQEGVVNHDGGAGWVMEHLYIHDSNGSAVMFGSDNVLQDSCLTYNGQYAWNSIGGSGNIVMQRNEISYNNTGDWETQLPGCGCSGGGKFWDAHGVKVLDNWVHHNHGVGIWADQNNYDFLIAGNVIEDNEKHAIEYETSYNAVIRDNILRRNTWKQGREFEARGDTFPLATIYLSEAGYDPRLPAPENATSFVVKNNVLEDNWGGIAGWENADRFCNSPANTSTGYCTIKSYANGSPTWYATGDCSQPGIASDPLYSDCRWSTKNLDIHHNTFSVDTAKVDGGCAANYCATMSQFSNYGTVPDWSPYKGRVIQESITFRQNNKWHDNTYVGPWRWVPYEPGRYLTFVQWQAAPYEQDAGSSSAG